MADFGSGCGLFSTPMLVTDVGDEICWWKVWNVGDNMILAVIVTFKMTIFWWSDKVWYN